MNAGTLLMSAGRARTSVVTIGRSTAFLARIGQDGTVSRRSIERGLDSQGAFFARIADAIGNHDRLVILGQETARLAFEREYVLIYHRPDRLVDVPA